MPGVEEVFWGCGMCDGDRPGKPGLVGYSTTWQVDQAEAGKEPSLACIASSWGDAQAGLLDAEDT